MRRRTFLASLSALAGTKAVQSERSRLRVLVITGQTDLPYHDWTKTTPFLKRVLESTGRFEVTVLDAPKTLSASMLAPYQAVILNYNGPRWGAEPEKALEDFLRAGGGMVAFHGVSYGAFLGMEQDAKGRFQWSTKPDAEWKAYKEMIGTTWEPANIGHSARHEFRVKFADPDHPITRGLGPDYLIDDELYHKMAHMPGIRVIMTAYSDPAKRGTGKDEPIAWTVSFGKGRVFHTTNGHDLRAINTWGFLTTFARALEWVATGDVTLTGRIDPIMQ
ncbi:MAG TPA: ThuA domain-containing protein [Bryobacteraceae bacterium]|nr:ThuA domain-containing protein [Bryobacteraceae bacterium]